MTVPPVASTPADPTAPVFRQLTDSEAPLFRSLPDAGLVGRAITGVEYRTVAEGGDYRPEWSWVALRDGVVVARAAWWGGPDDREPLLLNWFDVADGEDGAGAELLRRAPWNVEYELIAPAGWRDDPALRAAVGSRTDAARAAGMKPLVERFQYRWTPDLGLPERPGRLEFRPEPDDDVIFDVLRRVHSATLDAHASRTTDEEGLDRAAQEELDFFRWCPSPREWWQLAYDPAGELVGIHVPAHNPSGPCVGFIGVVPEQRGHGYAYDLLVECTNVLAENGAEFIAGGTDQGNFPMAAHFTRAGYPVVQERINLV
ncbi:GNAT family N-acetyltransferase [Streptomyces sp. IB2014 016-6]|uniref:GNAT family N-acetyltransferase n=1 Tax=Streptomyces sp. IB2014 016-6 TaxID=2517818 RepID=UPI0011C94388|nr:GNAT family N-acetyltransferase [Streptomyces sp. IB2014 016-6]TXL89258.1 GNAT family N-acetyltransferase [Streptomyces sp. IB2014 016-6]